MFPASPTPGSPQSPRSCGPSSPSSARSLDDLLSCPVCLDTYDEPKTLQCLHSFCARCLESCKNPYRRNISCPVCKKVTILSPQGVPALQNDFRIQQIRDVLLSRDSRPPPPDDASSSSAQTDVKFCDVCKSQQRKVLAGCHCLQCLLYFCDPCREKHTSHAVFSTHHVIDVGSSSSSDSLFCRIHSDHPVRYFCKPCVQMLCTLCTMEHNPTHVAEPLEKEIINKYRKELKCSLKSVKSKLSEFNTRTKFLETWKQSYQKALYDTQVAIRQRSEQAIEHIREEEQRLMSEAQEKMEAKLRQSGMEQLTEMNFRKRHLEDLYSDLVRVIDGSPQQCLISYDDLKNRMASISETTLPSLTSAKNSFVKFVPASVEMTNLVGTLKECALSEDEERASVKSVSVSGLTSSNKNNNGSKSTQVSQRMSSIMQAVSPGRPTESKRGRLKGCTRAATSPNTIRADELIGASASEPRQSPPCTSPSSPTLPTSEPATPSTVYARKPALLMKVDQVGGWSGRIMAPSGVAFLPNGNLVVAESESRLQVFNKLGHSVRIIGWGKIKPFSVAVTRQGLIAVTDRQDRTVKIYRQDGECHRSWEHNMFSCPSGLAVTSGGNFVVTDSDRHMVSIHSPEGVMISHFGSWGSGEYMFNAPSHVVVDSQDNLIVSDSVNAVIKVFDKNGVFKHSFNVLSSTQGTLCRPQGIAVDRHGQLFVADREAHQVSLFSAEGRFVRSVLSKQDGVRYPCDLCVNGEGHMALVESHSGFPSKEPHHAVKLYQLHSP